MGLVFKAIILEHPRIIHVRGCQGHGRGQRLMDWSAGCAPVKEKLRLEKMSDNFECSNTIAVPKGQLISKCSFDVKTFSRISALASKMRSNQKKKGNLYH